MVVVYVSKWVEVIVAPTCDANVVIKMFSKIVFPRFGNPRTVIIICGSHFKEMNFNNLLKKYGIKHMVGTLHHP